MKRYRVKLQKDRYITLAMLSFPVLFLRDRVWKESEKGVIADYTLTLIISAV